MSEVYTCPAGHQWQPFDEPLEARPDSFVCPVCGAGPLSEAAALPPPMKLTRRRLALAGCVLLLTAAVGYGAYFLWQPHPALTLHPHAGQPVAGVAFSPDCSVLLTGGGDGKLRLWDVPTGRERLEINAHSTPVTCVAFAPNGDWLVSGGEDGRVAVWDAHTGAELGSAFHPRVQAVAVSPDSRLGASVGSDCWLRVWDVATREERLRFYAPKTPLWSVAYSPDGKHIAIGQGDSDVRLLDADSGRQIAFVPAADHLGLYVGIAFSPDGKLLALQGPKGSIQLLDATTGRPVSQFPTSHSKEISCMAFSNNGKWLVSGSGGSRAAGEVIISDIERGREVVTLNGHSKCHTAVAVSRDGKYLATASLDGTAKLWDLDKLIGPGR